MKALHSQRQWQRADGSALMTAAIAAAVLGILVVGYLSWVTNEYRLGKRSHQWAQALNLAEAAVEIGLAELNYEYVAGNGFKGANGWVNLGGGLSYSKTVTNFTDSLGQTVGSYSVTVTNQAGTYPVVLGVGTCSNSSGPAVSRAINVVVKKGGAGFALVAKNGISFTNPSFYVDSYDSTDPTKSTGGLYDAAKHQPNAVMGILGGTMALKGDIYGTLQLLGGGSVSQIQSVGNTFVPGQRSTTIADAVTKGYIVNGDIPSLPTPTTPFDPAGAIQLAAINGNYTNSGSGDYSVPSMKAGTGQTITLIGNKRIYVSGDITFSGGGISIPAGSSLELYVNGKITMSGSSFVNNANKSTSCSIYGLTATTWSLTGGSAFVAVLYAPDVDIKFTGGTGFCGMMTGNSFSTTGAGAFHYDEALGGGGGSAYRVASWQEYRNVSGSWVP